MHLPESGPRGGSKPDPPSFFPWRLQWGLSVFQWGSNPHNPPPPASFYPGSQYSFFVKSSLKNWESGQHLGACAGCAALPHPRTVTGHVVQFLTCDQRFVFVQFLALVL